MLKSRRVTKSLLAVALGGLGLLLPLPVGAAGGENSLDLKYMYYWDRNKVWNHTPTFAWLQNLPGYFKFKWNQEFDAVSGASRRLGLRNVGRLGEGEKALDGITGASRREIRHSEQASVGYDREGRVAWASLYYSDEHDYTSWSPAASMSWDFNDRNTTVSGSWALFLDAFTPRGGFAGQGGDRRIQSVSAGLAQVLTPLSLFSVTVNPIFSSGYLGHPYNPVVTDSGAMLAEHLPDSKVSAALSGRFVQGFHLGEKLGSLHAEYRYYRDDWRLASNTFDLQWHQYFTETAYFRLRARAYNQGSAAFYKDRYVGNEAYRTADIRFGSFSSLTVGAKVAGAFPETWAASLLLPDRWDLGYDHGIRDTKGEGDLVRPYFHYQLYAPDQYYLQGTLMVGLGFDL
jgi:hypothetical protein